MTNFKTRCGTRRYICKIPVDNLPIAAYYSGMTTQYTSAQVAQKTGKAERTIRQLAEAHDDIGARLGRWWVFTDADVVRIQAISKGRPRKPRRRQAPAPAPVTEEAQP
jgi:hypothetical protein